MCVLKVYIKLFIIRNIFSGIEKTVITFSIFKKFFFHKWKLMYALKPHISKILITNGILCHFTLPNSSSSFSLGFRRIGFWWTEEKTSRSYQNSFPFSSLPKIQNFFFFLFFTFFSSPLKSF